MKNNTNTMKNTIEDFKIGDNVNVEHRVDDAFAHDFTGHITTIVGNYIIVRDQDDDSWSCVPEQLSHSSDDIMHEGE